MNGTYRRKHISFDNINIHNEDLEDDDEHEYERDRRRPYFEVLIVDAMTANQAAQQTESLKSVRRDEDSFVYVPVFVHSLEDALIACLFNHNIQSVIIRYGFGLYSESKLNILQRYLHQANYLEIDKAEPDQYGVMLANVISRIRPELDLFLVTDQSVEEIAGSVGDTCRRVFYNKEDFLELHLNILRGIESRFNAPFFKALKEYSKKPTGVFHALPISRG
jgi:hypothetical protein